MRDPLVIFEGRVQELDDKTQTDHFENIQSTNWQTVRWKPPPPDEPFSGQPDALKKKKGGGTRDDVDVELENAAGDTSSSKPHIGWRTEFRPMEVQLTDFENAVGQVIYLTRTWKADCSNRRSSLTWLSSISTLFALRHRWVDVRCPSDRCMKDV